ncbi:hypothetical protein D9758_014595 [Tetrapyrgos nigripes]|uniref:Beta-lactamase-related domain-containing protein n=1 Tax=Tetrapyrgos nigripes TaxID=182062 RepID=A0A8H5FCI1_9AGAR|nr:hypothetical protein D9758_014595 [Tetrapyrgos nigripes]
MDALRQTLRDATGVADRTKQTIPPVVIMAKDASGTIDIKEHYGFLSTKHDSLPIDFDSAMWMASCTKLPATIAAMQLVEKGLVDLDEDITRVLPEWKDRQILTGFEEGTGKPTLRPSEKKMTLRHLLTHSSGMGYGIMTPLVEQYVNYMKIVPKGKSLVELQDHSLLPLLFEPGEGWYYGFSIDWAGTVVERISGCASLGEYFAKHIWGPLGLDEKDWTFHPQNDDFKKHPRVEMQVRQPDGSMKGIENIPLPIPGLGDGTGEYDSGGAGLYMKPSLYFRMLESLMRNDEVLLKKETREMLFMPQLKDNKYIMEHLELVNKIVEPGNQHTHLMGLPIGTQVNWGLGGMLMMDTVEGKRKKGTMWWGGMPNLIWWIDPSSKLTGFFATQMFPPGDGQVGKTFNQFEKALYEELNK